MTYGGSGGATSEAGSEAGPQARAAEGEPALRRSLGFRDLVVYGLLFIAPMAPVGVFGTLDAKSHGAGWRCWRCRGRRLVPPSP
ncbi:hypothetical protein K4G64_28895 [Streptomyces sp. WAC04114]|nr:hypothetical protein [Streptomyces sp. WAC04114]MBX9365112.1 hypothetical protein [Streptomyces sp. WAC04114]